jgi:hypothetical protein
MFWSIRASALVLALPVSSAVASVQDRISESRVPLPSSDGREHSAEIGYVFDTAHNVTSARFTTSLASRNILSSIFRGAPPVHTLTAAYDFVGRGPLAAPDSIRISLTSDELSQSYSGNGLARAPELVLALMLGDSVARFPLSIRQKTEVWWPRDRELEVARPHRGVDGGINFDAPTPQVHIERTATVRLSACAFFALLAGKDVHGTAGGLDFDLNEDVIAGLREFAAEMTPTGGSGASASCRSR